MTFQASPQQADYFSWIQNGSGSCVLEAVAGSGKTTTLIEGLKLMKGKIFFGAYNKKIAEEIKAKAPQLPNLTVSTMHAAGYGAWRRAAPNVKVDNHKVRDIFRNRTADKPQYGALEGPIVNLVSLAKQAGLGATRSMEEYDSWLQLVEHFDVETGDQERLIISLAKRLLTLSIEQDQVTVDFDDMIFAPLAHKVRTNEYDWVLIDEAQDTNATRRALALLMLKRGGRLVAVGDRHQAIYGFTGADADSLDLIGKAVSAKELPLTVTYRCPKAVVKEAQKYVSHIQAHESAPEGSVRGLDVEKGETLMAVAQPGDAILCRFNKPIVEAAYQFIAAGIPAKVEGREIGNGLKTLARRWKSKTYGDLLEKLAGYEEREVSKYRAKEEESKAVAVEDKVSCLKLLIERAMRQEPNAKSPVDAVCAIIDDLFGDDVGKEAVLLSTIHKSKGREWNRVFWLQTGPSKWARKAWELEQEKNLCYVAVTRAKQELVLA